MGSPKGDDNVPHELTSLIGYVIFAFNDLEETLSSGICDLISDRSEDKGRIVIMRLNFTQKVDLYRDLVGHLLHTLQKKTLLQRLDSLVKKVNDLGRRRNQIIHAAWLDYDPKTSSVVTKIKLRARRIERHRERIAFEHIDKLFAEIGEVTEQFYTFHEGREAWFRP